MKSRPCTLGLLVLFLGAGLSAQDRKEPAIADQESSYLLLQGAMLGEITQHDAMMASYHVPVFVDRLKKSGRTIPEAVNTLLKAAREANEKTDYHRAFRLFARAAGLAQGVDKVEASEVAASYKFSPDRAIYARGEKIVLTLRPLFSLGRPLTGTYSVHTWLENTSGVIAGSEQQRAVTELRPEIFNFSIDHLADGVVATGYRLDSGGEVLVKFKQAVLIAKDAQERLTELKTTFAAMKGKGASGQTTADVPALETIEYLLQALEKERSGFDGNWQRLAHPFGMYLMVLNFAVSGRPTQEFPSFAGRIRYPEDVVFSLTLAKALAAGSNTFLKQSGDMQQAYRSAMDGELIRYRVFVPKGYDPTRKYPLMVALHSGAGEGTYFEWESIQSGDGTKRENSFTQFAQEKGYIIACPNGRGDFFSTNGEEDVLAVLERVQKIYSIDPDHMFLTGWSLGSAATWRIAIDHPGRFKAIAPVVGEMDWMDRENIGKLAGLRILFSAAGKDSSSIVGARSINSIVKELVPGFRYVEYPEATHDNVWLKALPAIFGFFDSCTTPNSRIKVDVPRVQVAFIESGQKLDGKGWDVTLVDINEDGILEAYFDGAIWLNDGRGHFKKSDRSFWPGGGKAYFADFNGDGHVDVLCGKVISLNDGHGHFTETSKVPCDIGMISVFLGDLRGNGIIDIIAGDQYFDRILLNDGHGNFTNTGRGLGGWGQSSYAVGDINGDGIPDVYVAIPHIPPEGGHTSNQICLGDGTGDFTSHPHDVPNALPRGVVLTDLNGDGFSDLVLSDQGDWGGTGKVFFNDGKGNLTDSGQNLGAKTGTIKVYDFDGDGHPDLIMARGALEETDMPIKIWVNDGHGHCTDSGLRIGSASTFDFQLGDVNGDGKVDIIATHVVKIPFPTFADVWLGSIGADASVPR